MTKSQNTQRFTAEELKAVDLFARLTKDEQNELLLNAFKRVALGYAVKVLRDAQKELTYDK